MESSTLQYAYYRLFNKIHRMLNAYNQKYKCLLFLICK